MEAKRIAFNIDVKHKMLFAKAEKIRHKGAILSMCFATSLFSAYTSVFGHANFVDFIQALDYISAFRVVPCKDARYTVISSGWKLNMQLVDAVIKDQMSGDKPTHVLVQSSDSWEDDNTISIIEHKSTRKEEAAESWNGTSAIPSTDPDKYRTAAQKQDVIPADSRDTQNHLPKKRYDDFSSEASDNFKPPSKFRSILENGSRPEQNDLYERTQSNIIAAFEEACVVPLGLFKNMLCNKHGVGIDYKKTLCKIKNHKHSSLSKLLGCYRNILQLKVLRLTYAVLLTSRAKEQATQRESAYILQPNDPMFKLGIEMLLTSLFPIKANIPIEDLIELAKHVYKRLGSVEQLNKAFLVRMRSPNLAVLQYQESCSVTVTPLSSDGYKKWCVESHHEKLLGIERRISGGEKITISGVVSSLSSKIFGDESNADILRIADLNIPKFILQPAHGLYDDSQPGTPLWMYIHHSVNFDDKNTFYFS